jgi:hypothetical protein
MSSLISQDIQQLRKFQDNLTKFAFNYTSDDKILKINLNNIIAINKRLNKLVSNIGAALGVTTKLTRDNIKHTLTDAEFMKRFDTEITKYIKQLTNDFVIASQKERQLRTSMSSSQPNRPTTEEKKDNEDISGKEQEEINEKRYKELYSNFKDITDNEKQLVLNYMLKHQKKDAVNIINNKVINNLKNTDQEIRPMSEYMKIMIRKNPDIALQIYHDTQTITLKDNKHMKVKDTQFQVVQGVPQGGRFTKSAQIQLAGLASQLTANECFPHIKSIFEYNDKFTPIDILNDEEIDDSKIDDNIEKTLIDLVKNNKLQIIVKEGLNFPAKRKMLYTWITKMSGINLNSVHLAGRSKNYQIDFIGIILCTYYIVNGFSPMYRGNKDIINVDDLAIPTTYNVYAHMRNKGTRHILQEYADIASKLVREQGITPQIYRRYKTKLEKYSTDSHLCHDLFYMLREEFTNKECFTVVSNIIRYEQARRKYGKILDTKRLMEELTLTDETILVSKLHEATKEIDIENRVLNKKKLNK